MLGNKRGSLIDTYVPNYVVFDLETTGISPGYDEVIEISALKVRNGRVADEFSKLVNPGMRIPRQASAVNNITDDMVKKAPFFKEVLTTFLSFIEDDILVGHNIKNFDMKFLYRDCEKYFNQTLTNDYIDTLIMARRCFPENRHHRLGDIADIYGISTTGAHRALADCRINQKVFEKMALQMNESPVKNIGIKTCRQENSEPDDDMILNNMDRNTRICPKCNRPLKRRRGMFGEFWGCTGYPKCRYTQNL